MPNESKTVILINSHFEKYKKSIQIEEKAKYYK